jgi:hypothetical protein
MISKRACALFVVVVATAPSLAAFAKATEATPPARAVQPIEPLLVADVVVNGAPQQAAPPPAAAPAQAAPAPVIETPARATVVEHEQHNYMTTVAVSGLMGGLAGVLIGGSLFYLADDQTHAARIGYWAAGGVLVGVGVGITQVVVQESRVDRVTSRLPSDPAPTFRLALYQAKF